MAAQRSQNSNAAAGTTRPQSDSMQRSLPLPKGQGRPLTLDTLGFETDFEHPGRRGIKRISAKHTKLALFTAPGICDLLTTPD